MITTPTIPVPTSPQLWDYAMAELQTELTGNITWLDAAFGKAQRRIGTGKDGRTYTFPAVYSGTGDYLSMLPDGHIGNFSWVDVLDYQDLQYERDQFQKIRADIGLVFWLDLRTAYTADYENRTIEHAKADVLDALRAIRLTRSVLLIDRVAERPDKHYSGYSHNEIRQQFLMFPYTGFRFEGQVHAKEQCP